MKKIAAISLLYLLVVFPLYSQNEVDALRYSQIYYGGTARFSAMGGAFGSLGGDFSALSTNPAAIGIYKSSEITISPANYFMVTRSEYSNMRSDDLDYNFNVGNAGFVFAFIPKKSTSFKAVQFGFGINRLNNFNSRVTFEGPNASSSILDDYRNTAEGTVPSELDPFTTQLAFNTYLIDTLGSLTHYYSAVPFAGTQQSKTINTSGSINEMLLSIGANYNDVLYFGASIGFPMIRYFEETYYEERDIADTMPDFKKMSNTGFLETHGSGFNFKFGLIYRPANWVRIGAAIHTPTFYSMSDQWNSSMESKFHNGDQYYATSPQGSFRYELNTPFRAMGSIGFVIGKVALLSGEYEYVDYRQARLHSPTYRFQQENSAMDTKYTMQHNVRAGVEFRVGIVSLRGGYTYSSSPFASKADNDGQRHSANGGIGFKLKRFFIDLSYTYLMTKEYYYLYPSNPLVALNRYHAHNIQATLGVKF